ncbi:MAG: bifunctional 4-hydroxy-3-methylbut-2-enyl diphosphate reductase/30S ribosomal protein S1 [Firmicutes bacterium]|nr:bifunctional 4-hydroxy-3-methylbut-2-enyl diphosphate reductase/30S ribosomal protein S1 [Bacillota bacterium]
MEREVVIAKNSGFCFGVKKALDIAEERIKSKGDGNLYTCGPLIHNALVTDELESRGCRIIESIDDAKPGDTVIVRSHGEPESFYREAEGLGVNVVDATCPFVARIHELVNRAYKNGERIIIVGDPEHQEVRATNGWCDNSAIIVDSKEKAEDVPLGEYFLVCQTTIRRELLDEITESLIAKGISLRVENTICNATTDRQDACAELAAKSDVMVVIGDRHSSNTRKLYEISKRKCENSFFVENIDDLPLKEVEKYSKIGVAAGASTPESVIKEVIARMSEAITNENVTMADFMDEIEASTRLPRNGEIVTGTVHQVSDKELVVNLGCKKDGILPADEITLEEGQKLTDVFKPGDEIQAKVIKTDDSEGSLLLSKKRLEIGEHWTEINEAHENRDIINVKVVRAVNGGVIAAYKEVTGFIPLSQLSDRFVENENVNEFIGETMDVRVTRVDPRRNRAVFSHKAVLMDEKQKQIADVWDKLHVDDVVEGTVMRFTDYGAFVDIGGLDGLLHISEISWGKLKHPQEVLEIGDKVNVKILSMNQEKNKISLGLKQITPEPWTIITEKYNVGDIVSGKVVQLKEYGAFVELEPGLDGLVHISEVAHKRVGNIGDELKLGQTVETKILDIDMDRKRISLSIKAATPAPEGLEEEAAADADAPIEAQTEAPVEGAVETPIEEAVETASESVKEAADETVETVEEVAETAEEAVEEAEIPTEE